MITLFVEITALPGNEQLFCDSLKAMLKPSREEEGCLEYRITQSNNNPIKFFTFECFRSQEALDLHISSEYYKNLIETIGKYLAEEPKMEFTTEL